MTGYRVILGENMTAPGSERRQEIRCAVLTRLPVRRHRSHPTLNARAIEDAVRNKSSGRKPPAPLEAEVRTQPAAKTLEGKEWINGLSLSHDRATLITGDDAGQVTLFDRAAGTWGAFEVVGRLSSIKFDNQAFAGTSNQQIVDPAKSARSADTYGVGLNWYLSKVARFCVDYEYPRFHQATGATSPAVTSVISKPERALLTCFSLNF